MKVLLISPHTDDVELGSGGTVLKFLESGHEMYWVTFSIAEDSLPNGMGKGVLRDEFTRVIDRVGIDSERVDLSEYRVRRLHEHRQEILEKLVSLRGEYEPDLVIGLSLNDFHQDHQVITWEMIRAFIKSSSIICYELPWNQVDFSTQLFVCLKERHVEGKWEVLRKYESQIEGGRDYFTRDFIYSLAKTRGVQAGCPYAEAYEVVRWKM